MPKASQDQIALTLPPVRAAAATPESADRQRWGMLAGGVVVMILLSNYQYCFTLFTPGMKEQFSGVPYADIALIFSIFVLFETWPVPLAGALIDRFGIRQLMLIGSALVLREGGGIANRSMLVDPDGRVVVTYDKMHMFDVDLPSGERVRESEAFTAGDAAGVADLPWLLETASCDVSLRWRCVIRKALER